MPRKPLLVVYLLFLVAVKESGLRAETSPGLTGLGQREPNAWSARSSTGRTLGGAWSGVADPATGSVTGTWTLVDASGKPVMRGGWSAAKARKGWTGAWRAAISGSKAEYSGTWSADVDLKPDAPLADLFKSAVQTAVSGNWRAGNHSGAWSIRVFE